MPGLVESFVPSAVAWRSPSVRHLGRQVGASLGMFQALQLFLSFFGLLFSK